ncbi:MAG: class I tRNA ligase family protein, partial [Pseudomonadota bacterium]|nr:class I tRNA ligase family protein [Pseudomonadota bacterium]
QHQNLTEADEAYIGQFNGIIGDVRQEMEALQFHKALERIWQAVYSANQYMDAQEPWVLRKTDPERMATVLRVLMESFKYITALIKPFMPEAASKFEAQLNWQVTDYKTLEEADFFSLNVESEIQKPSGVFMRVENKEAA